MIDETLICAGLASFPDPGVQLFMLGTDYLLKIRNQIISFSCYCFLHVCVCVCSMHLFHALLHLLTC